MAFSQQKRCRDAVRAVIVEASAAPSTSLWRSLGRIQACKHCSNYILLVCCTGSRKHAHAAARVVLEQLVNEVDVCEEHAATAVPLQLQRVQDVPARARTHTRTHLSPKPRTKLNTMHLPRRVTRAQETATTESRAGVGGQSVPHATPADILGLVILAHHLQVRSVLIPDDLPAREATHRDQPAHTVTRVQGVTTP